MSSLTKTRFSRSLPGGMFKSRQQPRRASGELHVPVPAKEWRVPSREKSRERHHREVVGNCEPTSAEWACNSVTALDCCEVLTTDRRENPLSDADWASQSLNLLDMREGTRKHRAGNSEAPSEASDSISPLEFRDTTDGGNRRKADPEAEWASHSLNALDFLQESVDGRSHRPRLRPPSVGMDLGTQPDLRGGNSGVGEIGAWRRTNRASCSDVDFSGRTLERPRDSMSRQRRSVGIPSELDTSSRPGSSRPGLLRQGSGSGPSTPASPASRLRSSASGGRPPSRGLAVVAKVISQPDEKPSDGNRDKQDMRVPLLATKYRLELHEVRKILVEFDRTARAGGSDNCDEARMSEGQFRSFLRRVFAVSHIPDDVALNSYEGCGGHTGLVSIEKFLQWYTIHMFTVVNVLNADLNKAAGNELIYHLAKKHQVSPLTIDKIKTKFDLYDADGSGEIEFEEFKFLFTRLLKVKSERDLSQERAMRAWKEIDTDRSGGVDFTEFTEWYLKYLWTPEESDEARGPAEAFYDSFNPVVQRHQVLEKSMLPTGMD